MMKKNYAVLILFCISSIAYFIYPLISIAVVKQDLDCQKRNVLSTYAYNTMSTSVEKSVLKNIDTNVKFTPNSNHNNLEVSNSNQFVNTSNKILPPGCTTLIYPSNGEVDIPITPILSWNPQPTATGYFISMGTSSGSSDLVNNANIVGSTVFAYPSDLPENTEVFVTITPYDSTGSAINCSEESFTTEIIGLHCTNLISPFNTETNVSIVTDLSWDFASQATGYLLTVGTTSGGNDILNNHDVGTLAFYTFTSILLPNTQYYVTITPYNNTESATGCAEETFITGSQIPDCTAIILPINGAIDVSISTDISWNTVDFATGYYLTIGLTSGGTEIFDNIDLGSLTSYDLPNDLPENTEVFVSVTPYSSYGIASGCQKQSFITETIIPIAPDCSDILFPQNNSIDVPLASFLSWQAVANVEGYFLNIGTTSNGTDILNYLDVGDVTSYDLSNQLEANTQYYITVIPYNDFGNATGCLETFFITEEVIPECTYLISPYNGELDVLESTNITWYSISNADGYTLSLGTTLNGTELLNNLDVLESTYTPNLDLPEGETIYVTITPYNFVGEAFNCQQESFTIIDYPIHAPAFFTANGDAYNNTWKVIDTEQEIKQIFIFDRFGKLLKTITNTNEGWDGTFRGQKLPTDDYWYVIELFDGNTQKGHFTLKR